LNELEKMKLQAYKNALIDKERTKRYHNKNLIKRGFNIGQPTLLFNSSLKLFPWKLKSKWSRLFVIKSASPHGVVELIKPDSDETFKLNGQRLKPYHEGELPYKMEELVLTDL